MKTRQQLLSGLGIRFTSSYQDETLIQSVTLSFTSNEWVSLTHGDGDNYIGGCCGTTSVMQDIISGCLREGGSLRYYDLRQLGTLGLSHDEKDWMPPTDEVFQTLISDWETISPWQKIGLIFSTVKDRLTPDSEEAPETNNHPDLKGRVCYQVAQNALTYLRYEDLCSLDDSQHKANRGLLTSRLIPALQEVMSLMAKNHEPFRGFALVESSRPNTVVTNRYGYCIFGDQEKAKELMDRWKDKNLRIRPVLVTIEGLTFTDL